MIMVTGRISSILSHLKSVWRIDMPKVGDKIRIIDIETAWQNLTKSEQNKILQIFNIDLKNINFEKELAIILTQPLSETEHNISLDEELTIYKDMIEKYNRHVILKPHPRDLKNYQELIPNVEVIDRFFPIELLNLIGIKPSVVCSVSSTALLNFKDSELYVYENEISNPILDGYRKDLIKLINDR